jgi:Uma2 family endonuclease
MTTAVATPAAVAPQRMTLEHYLATPVTNRHVEFINNEIIEMASPTVAHQFILEALNDLLYPYKHSEAFKAKVARLILAPMDVLLPSGNIVQPDLFVVFDFATRNPSTARVEAVPEWVCEILSPSNEYYDLVTKKKLYEQAGVQEYWIADPMGQQLEAYELRNGRYETLHHLSTTGTLASNVLQGFAVDVQALFATATGAPQ